MSSNKPKDLNTTPTYRYQEVSEMENQTQILEQRVREALRLVEEEGIDGYGIRELIERGLDHNFYTQKQVDAAQTEFEASHTRE